jgi:hypothetical protein
LDVFGWILDTIAFTLEAIGCFWGADWSPLVLPGSILGDVGSSVGPFGCHLVSFWVPQAVKIQTVEDQADIGKTYENHWFSFIFEGWLAGRLAGWLAGGLAGRLAGCLVGSLAGRGFAKLCQTLPPFATVWQTLPDLRPQVQPPKKLVDGYWNL